MKKKNNIDAEQLEKLDSDLFRAFDPEDEIWLVGGSYTITGGLTCTAEGIDQWRDLDGFPTEVPEQV